MNDIKAIANPIPFMQGTHSQQHAKLWLVNCPNDSSSRKNGIPMVKNMIMYGTKKAPANKKSKKHV